MIQLSYWYMTTWKTISSVQLLSHVWLFVTQWLFVSLCDSPNDSLWDSLWPAAHQASLSITYSPIALTIRTLLTKWCLCFSTQSSFVIAFFPRSKCLISWLQAEILILISKSAVILEPKKIESLTVSIFYPSIAMKRSWMSGS